jgi:hypothetical protein
MRTNNYRTNADPGTLLGTIQFLDLSRSLDILAPGRRRSFLILLFWFPTHSSALDKIQEGRFKVMPENAKLYFSQFNLNNFFFFNTVCENVCLSEVYKRGVGLCYLKYRIHNSPDNGASYR